RGAAIVEDEPCLRRPREVHREQGGRVRRERRENDVEAPSAERAPARRAPGPERIRELAAREPAPESPLEPSEGACRPRLRGRPRSRARCVGFFGIRTVSSPSREARRERDRPPEEIAR